MIFYYKNLLYKHLFSRNNKILIENNKNDQIFYENDRNMKSQTPIFYYSYIKISSNKKICDTCM